MANKISFPVNTSEKEDAVCSNKKYGKKKGKDDLTELGPEEKLKYEIAEELGLLDRVMQDGWKSLTSKETGRIGGMVTGRRREIKKQTEITDENAKE